MIEDRVFSFPNAEEPLTVHREDGWEITLQMKSTKCGWLNVFLSPVGDVSGERYALAFNSMHQIVDCDEEWDRLWTNRRDMAMWFYEKMKWRFPSCEFCNEMWRREGCP